MKTIKFYKTVSGDSPVEDFLDNLPSKHAQKVVWVLQAIEDLDIVPTSYLKKLVNTDDIWEVRITSGGNIFRLLGFMEGNNFLILNHGFQKKTQKTPRKFIAIAETRKKEYLSRSSK